MQWWAALTSDTGAKGKVEGQLWECLGLVILPSREIF